MRQTVDVSEDLAAAARAVMDAITFDDSGTNGRGGNGGLISRTTIRRNDELRLALQRFDRQIGAGGAVLTPENTTPSQPGSSFGSCRR